MVTVGDNPLKSSVFHPGSRRGGSRGVGAESKFCLALHELFPFPVDLKLQSAEMFKHQFPVYSQ